MATTTATVPYTTPLSCTCDDWKYSDSIGYRCDHMKNLGKPIAQAAIQTVSQALPQNQSFANLHFELVAQALNSKCGPRTWAFIELHGVLDDLADSEWVQYASAAEVAYKTTRADVLRALCDRFDAEAGNDVSSPLANRLASFYLDYTLNRI